MHLPRALLACIAIAIPSSARAWDAAGHRTITALALDSLPASTPAWISARAGAITDQAVVPDRWRGVRSPALSNLNGPDHYIDLEDLTPLGMRLDSLPPLRYEFIRAVAIARVDHPVAPPVNPAADPAKLADWPGFLPWAICETHGKIISGLKIVRMLERLRDQAQDAEDSAAVKLRVVQLEMARADVSVHMGVLAHYIGDAAQPLHTTIHHHGWVGDNPSGYTTDRGIHSYIDGAIVTHHGIDFASLRPAFQPREGEIADALSPWPEALAHIQRSFDQVVPLYELKKSGGLEQDEGKAFIAARFTDAASTLAMFYRAAIDASTPTEDDLRAFLRYDKIDAGQLAAPREAGPGAP